MNCAAAWEISNCSTAPCAPPPAPERRPRSRLNAARLGVAIQGLGLAEVAYQNALGYAKDRIQGRALTGAKDKSKPADPIKGPPITLTTSVTFIPELGESTASGTQKNIEKMAIQIINMMQMPW